MKFQFLIYIFLLHITITNGQNNYGKVWVTGGGISYKITFEQSGIVNALLDTIYSPYFQTGNSNICDSNGNLILCSDGYNIYDSNANYIDGGDTLIPKDYYIAKDGWSLFSQSSIFLPIDSEKYYFITPTMSDVRYADCLANNHCAFDLLLYNVIDMKANGGAGKVVKRMVPLMENAELSKTRMMACRHANGKDWWLLKQGGYSNIVYKFLFTQDSIYDYGSQTFNAPVWNSGWDLRGQSMFSQDGSKYASTVDGIPQTGEVFIADFDRCYGGLSNEKIIYCPVMNIHNPADTTQKEKTTTGLAFSPNGQFLYVLSPCNIFQYDLQDDAWFHVAGLDTSFAKFQQYIASYLGPDNKLYIGNKDGLSKQMSVISNPDVKGPGCNFCPRCLRLDSVFWYGAAGTPPCMPNYSLGAQNCWPLNSSEIRDKRFEMEVWPNPASNTIHLKTKSREQRELYNSLGQLLISTKGNEIDVSGLAAGVYYLKCGMYTRKLIIE